MAQLRRCTRAESGTTVADYLRPRTIDDAVAGLRPGFTVIAGCTDYYCRPTARPYADAVVDITGVAGLRGVDEFAEDYRIGALTTWSELARATLPAPFATLQGAARQIGGVQVQNSGTLGGNICNASPAADGVPALLALDAEVELVSAAGTRRLPLAAFITGNRRTVLRPDELLTAFLVPKRAGRCASTFLKLGARAYQVISIVMVAALLETDAEGTVTAAAIAVGACSEVAQRLAELEAALLGRALSGKPLAGVLEPAHLAELRPLTDVRGSAGYRLDAARTLVSRALDDLQAKLSPLPQAGEGGLRLREDQSE